MTALFIAAETLSPHWIARFLTAVREYPAYGADPSVLQLFLPSLLAKLAGVGLVFILFVLCWKWRKSSPGSKDFARALAWVSAMTLVVLPKLAGYNQPILLPALLVLLAQRRVIWSAGFVPRSLVKLAFGCQLWQWMTATVLSLCSLLMPPARFSAAALVPEYTLFAFPVLTVAAAIAASFSQSRVTYPKPG
jgi:hypothetical protein